MNKKISIFCVILSLLGYFCLLTSVSYARASGEALTELQSVLSGEDFRPLGGAEAATDVTPDGIILRNSVPGELAGCTAAVCIDGVDTINIKFTVTSAAVSSLTVDLCSDGYDRPEQERQIALMLGENDVDININTGDGSPEYTNVRLFTHDLINASIASLLQQTYSNWECIIVDDGSTDNTKELVESWIKEAIIPIRYIYQDNQGMHGAHNTALQNIDSELYVCIDSDDWMPDDAVESILCHWQTVRLCGYAGLVGLDIMPNGNVIGDVFPKTLQESTLHDYYHSGGRGDKKVVLRTIIAKRYPEYPRFEGEKYFSLGYKFHLIDREYKFSILNKPLVVVNYQLDGSSYNMWKQYWNNPKGFMFLRKEYMRLYKSPRIRVKSCIHYIAHCIRAGRKREFFKTPCPLLSLFMLPIGCVLYFYTWRMVKHGNQMNFR